MSDFTVYPAIDVRGGRVVRLRQGDYAQETRYAEDPLAVAERYAGAGATWLHLVDLDAARDGGYSIQTLLTRIGTSTGLRVQTGGGVRSADDVSRLLDAGADRVVIGSLAVRQPQAVASWMARFGQDRLTIALDTRESAAGWTLPTEGWTHDGGVDLFDLIDLYATAGLRHLLCTDIGRDGMLAGPNLSLYEALIARAPSLRVQASGGARSAADVRAALDAGCAGIVLGKALLEGRLTVDDAIAAATEPAPC
ncbi:1-(5-phosphoribosyl)-5-[(5-phosphoribosylamino)methylideneamino]imidazole-4-carboxamide isomerase [Lysobacter sp. TY2-98]|uniref:1-(5-phosphoribosyl)-5-[(5- phosphoribosylamino)methylideneamino]imidazole-4- carboxamide isomerase n=1 Tax=Lysobacter sp. TY2-98 TaxID=2290922 RepID=UPI000E201B56|nr:1-(5-phosphoribosyl)-5-[(5-phosphoribosylamino)methylideneamino]imidazole-4-carboxamide isomerase [Lysobacter sp. TY2-98]AXK72232.1 1-(5-phosphoribosyl)-5-[(5-phosphoribosylamino)methylideneamino]imidazole-4-carboxamide isomerase [Lysobacter sp. TY2-98]